MVKKIIAICLSLLIAFSCYVPKADASEEIVAQRLSPDGQTVLEEYTDLQTALNDAQSSAGQSADTMQIVKLVRDIELNTTEYYGGSFYCGFMLESSCLDLNGHVINIKHDGDTSGTVCGGVISGKTSGSIIKNGVIQLDFSNSGTMTAGLFSISEHSVEISNVELVAMNSRVAFTGGIIARDHHNGALRVENSVIDVNGSALSGFGYNTTTIEAVSGTFKNLYGNNTTLPQGVGKPDGSEYLSISAGIDENKTVITSEDTTAMVVEGGNAYLYDTLQDAVDAKGHSESGSPTTIQLMKKTNEELTVGKNSSFTLDNYNEGNTFTGTIVDQFGNTIGTAESQSWTPTVTNGIATVPEGGSITTQSGTTITAGSAQGQTPSVNKDGTITVPAGATVQESGGPVVTAPEGGVVVGSDGKIIVSATGITLDRDTLNLYSNTTPNTATLVATVTPENTTDAVEWSSDNEDVATVTQNGVVTAHKDGMATITAKAGEETASCIVTVSTYHYTGKYSYEISVAQPDNGSVTVDKYATEGETVTITATPNAGYMLDTLSVTAGGKELEVTDNGDGTYSFTMPSSKVSISAAFAEDPDWVDPEQPEEPSTTVADIFNDVVPGAWYTDAVQYAYDNGLMTGTSATTFEPNTTTTRGMIVSMLHRLEGSPAVGSADFSDVAGGDWYADPVAWAASEGIVGGYGDGTFGPNDPITREQMASILYRYADYKGLDVSARASLDAYSDADSVSPWASDVMSWAVSEGIISGMTEDTLAPQGTATRAQVAAMFQRFLENVMA